MWVIPRNKGAAPAPPKSRVSATRASMSLLVCTTKATCDCRKDTATQSIMLCGGLNNMLMHAAQLVALGCFDSHNVWLSSGHEFMALAYQPSRKNRSPLLTPQHTGG